MLRPVDQQPVIGPDCGGRESANAFYFIRAIGCVCFCSLRIQERVSNRPLASRRPLHDSLSANLLRRIGCRRRCTRSARSAHRKFIRHLARQLIRPRRFARLVHGWRHLRLRASRRILRRRFGWNAWCRRRYFRRIDRHLCRRHYRVHYRSLP